MHVYNTSTAAWTNLTGQADPSSAPPSPRWGHGLVSAGGNLYIFGGIGEDGTLPECNSF
jgi:hypothetical protein